MTARVVVALLAALVALACSSRRQRPPGPPPEYERPRVTPWDSGAPVDPLDTVKGEEVTDDEPAPPATDAGASDAAPTDGG
ncbi:MAG: hypothetical protein L6Q84_26105 [Polyangiaceae bacterium]|nr:hypothetical protein [Polyangiaceae bacterium]